jgi:hypothetical protein
VVADTAYLGRIFPQSNSPPSSSEIQALVAVWAALAPTDSDGFDIVWNVQQALRRTVRWLKIWITPTLGGLGEERRRKRDALSFSIDYVRYLSSWWPVVPSGVGSSIGNDGLEATESSRLLLTDESSVSEGENQPGPPSSRQTPSRTDSWISLQNRTFRYFCLACIGTIALTVFGMKIWVSSGRQPIRQLLGRAVTRAIQWKGKSVFLLTMGGRKSPPLASNATSHNATVHNASIHNATLY